MAEMVLTTYDWVPPPPRGFVRDARIRWALEEARLPYRIETTSFRERGPEHFAHQPFGQVPWLVDGEISIFETGAILLHVGERSEALLPKDPKARADVVQWLFAALNSVEIVTQPWSLLAFSGEPAKAPGGAFWDEWLHKRLGHLDAVLGAREWLAGEFSIADVAMADVLRLPDRFGGLERHDACRSYVARATARPAFVTARNGQLAQFAAAD